MKINYPETPTGKRSVRRNIWGNLVGYVSGRRFWEFGQAYDAGNETTAKAWAAGKDLGAAQLAILES